MDKPQGRIERLEESLLYLERAAEVAAEQAGELFQRLDALAKRVAALEAGAERAREAANEPETDEAGGPDAGG